MSTQPFDALELLAEEKGKVEWLRACARNLAKIAAESQQEANEFKRIALRFQQEAKESSDENKRLRNEANELKCRALAAESLAQHYKNGAEAISGEYDARETAFFERSTTVP